jgi:pyruvate dehydrogenase complex dehydrogenase (E1) component
MPRRNARAGHRGDRLHARLRRADPLPGAAHYTVLGTDGFGRSDTREKLRHFFEVDRYWITLAALSALAEDGQMKKEKVAEAIKKYGLDPNKPNPVKV